MLYRMMQDKGNPLSILGFGCMRLPVNKDYSVDEAEARRQIRFAIDRGVNYVDTAYSYHNGQSEPILGRILKDGYREKVNVATKLPCWLINTREDMDRILNEQLQRLQTDHIDFYMLHGLTKGSWEKMKGLGAGEFLDAAVQDGRIRHAGFSFHHSLTAFKEIVDSRDWTFCQIQYNFMDEHYQAGTGGLHYAAKKGLGVIAMEPIRGGHLAKDVPGIREIWSRSTTGGKFSPAQWALRWVWNHPEVTLALSGMNTMQQVEQNLAVADCGLPNSLTKEEQGVFREVGASYRKRMKVDCTGCYYCMPCPSGVDIPGCFNQLNEAYTFDSLESAGNVYNMWVAKQGAASKCTECGTCVELCTQHIDIPEKLKEVVKCFGK
jgi:hypothetical protein